MHSGNAKIAPRVNVIIVATDENKNDITNAERNILKRIRDKESIASEQAK